LAVVVPFAAVSLMILSVDYFMPGSRHEGIDRSYRFLIFHDNSEDSLPKQDLARYLGERGCDYSQLLPSDPRISEALQFLSHGDWQVSAAARCPARHFQVERLAATQELPQNAEVFGQFRITWIL
jgi:hypothetical protein